MVTTKSSTATGVHMECVAASLKDCMEEIKQKLDSCLPLQRTINAYRHWLLCFGQNASFYITEILVLTIELQVHNVVVGVKTKNEVLVTIEVGQEVLVAVEAGHEELVVTGGGYTQEVVIKDDLTNEVLVKLKVWHKPLEVIRGG